MAWQEMRAFWQKSFFRAFFCQESSPGVYITVRDTFGSFSEKIIMIGRFRPFPAECVSPLLGGFGKTVVFLNVKFQNGLLLKYLSGSLKWWKIRKVWTLKFQTPGCKSFYDLWFIFYLIKCVIMKSGFFTHFYEYDEIFTIFIKWTYKRFPPSQSILFVCFFFLVCNFVKS